MTATQVHEPSGASPTLQHQALELARAYRLGQANTEECVRKASKNLDGGKKAVINARYCR